MASSVPHPQSTSRPLLLARDSCDKRHPVMLNLNDLTSDRGGNFLDISGVELKRVPDQDDKQDETDDVQSLHRRPWLDTSSVGSRSVTSPWEFEFSSRAGSEFQSFYLHGRMSGTHNHTWLDRPCSTAPDVSFAILGDGVTSMSSAGAVFPLRDPATREETRPRQRRTGYTLVVAVVILLCMATHAVGLLVYFTPWYHHAIQVAMFQRFYESFLQSGFAHSVDAKRDAVATVYLLIVGMVPTTIASPLWFVCSSSHALRRTLSSPRLLRRKPVLFAQYKPVYIEESYGELLLVVLLTGANVFIFVYSVLRFKAETGTRNDKTWGNVGRALAFNAVFNLVWLLLILLKPSMWTVYVDVFGIHNERTLTKYRNWLALLVVVCSALHAFCMVVQFQFTGESSPKLVSYSGMVVLGDIALGALLLLAVAPVLGARIPRAIALVLSPLGGIIFLMALCVHYPDVIVWLLPTLVPLLIQRAVAWTHSRYPVELVDMAPLPNGITRLVLRQSNSTMELKGGHVTAGQYVDIRLPQVSSLEWQRCTIASAPKRNTGLFTVYIHPPVDTSRSWSSADAMVAQEIHEVARVAYATKQPPTVYADGFYGPSHPIFYEKYPCVVFIAEDIGVVQTLAMLEQLYHEASLAAHDSPLDSKKIVLENRDEDDDASDRGDEAEPFNRQVWFLWSCDDVSLFREFEDLFFRIKTLDPHEIHFRMRFFLTKMPHQDDLQYQRLASAAFGGGGGVHATGTKKALITETTSMNTKSPHLQDRRSRSAWHLRPNSIKGGLSRILVLVLVTGAAVPLTVLVIWFALRTRANGEFPVVQLLRNVVLLLLTCVVVAGTVALGLDTVLRCQQMHPVQLHDGTHDVRRTDCTSATPPEGLKKLGSMTRMIGDASDEAEECGSFYPSDSMAESSAILSDVIERLRIYSMRPDVDKFLRTVGRSFPSFAGTIGVFASGTESFVRIVEASTLACEASTGDWHDVTADLDFHWLG